MSSELRRRLIALLVTAVPGKTERSPNEHQAIVQGLRSFPLPSISSARVQA